MRYGMRAGEASRGRRILATLAAPDGSAWYVKKGQSADHLLAVEIR